MAEQKRCRELGWEPRGVRMSFSIVLVCIRVLLKTIFRRFLGVFQTGAAVFVQISLFFCLR